MKLYRLDNGITMRKLRSNEKIKKGDYSIYVDLLSTNFNDWHRCEVFVGGTVAEQQQTVTRPFIVARPVPHLCGLPSA